MLFHIGNLEKVEKAISETEGHGICVSFRFIKMNTPIACKAAVQISAGKKGQPVSLMNSAEKQRENLSPLRPEAGQFHALMQHSQSCRLGKVFILLVRHLMPAFLVTGKNTCGQLPGYL